MADLNLPSNVKQDPNTGLYLITNARGKTVRVNADTQAQLDQYVNSVNTGVPATVTVTDPNTGNPRTRTFNPDAIVSQQDSVANQQQLLTAGKRQAGVIGNADGSYQDLRTGKTISQSEAAAKIQAAGLPPETLSAVTPKNSPAYAAAQEDINQTTNTPSNIPAANSLQPAQPQAGTSSNAAVTESVPAPAAAPTTPAQESPLPQEVITPAAPIPTVEVAQQTPQPQELPPSEVGNAEANEVAAAAPEPVNAATAAADFNTNTNTSVLNAIGVQAPAPVDPAQNPGAASPFGGGDFNRAARQNPEAVEAATQAAQVAQTRQQAAVQAEFQSPGNNDWRVKLKLAPNASYLYKDTDVANGILAPLAASGGVVFPYMPTIQTSYNAEYDSTDLTHSNYRGQFYKSSYVGDIQLTGTFTAQDTAEANYLLAVIHFFRSVTKMFYGARDPLRGAPPPLVYLIGLGQYQFNDQPCVVKTFNYSMPNDCDYIRTKPNNYNVNLGDRQTKTQTGLNPIEAVIDRLKNAGLKKGALPNVPAQTLLDLQSVYNIDNSTYVPTKCEISITLMPIQTRDQQSRLFNLQDYASGKLLKGGFW